MAKHVHIMLTSTITDRVSVCVSGLGLINFGLKAEYWKTIGVRHTNDETVKTECLLSKTGCTVFTKWYTAYVTKDGECIGITAIDPKHNNIGFEPQLKTSSVSKFPHSSNKTSVGSAAVIVTTCLWSYVDESRSLGC